MRCRLTFYDWHRALGSIYDTEVGLRLSTGDFHAGTTWDVEVTLPEDVAEELRQAQARDRARAVFILCPED